MPPSAIGWHPSTVRFTLLALASCLFLTLPACKASLSAEVNTGKKKKLMDFDKPMAEPVSASDQGEEAGITRFALLGARSDLSYSGAGNPACTCLAVSLGKPNDSDFAWSADVPRIRPLTQLVIAMKSKGVACKNRGRDDVEVSYNGYVQQPNGDVVVSVENTFSGRPTTTGAIIPKPGADGRIYLRPVRSKLAWGKPLKGKGLCDLGNPGESLQGAETKKENTRGTKRIGGSAGGVFQPTAQHVDAAGLEHLSSESKEAPRKSNR